MKAILFIIGILIATFPVKGQKTDFQKFVDTVNHIYQKELVFNDASLTINGVELVNYPVGSAFAYFNPTNNRRYVLINYQYLYKKLWQDTTFKNKGDALKVILAHEWAHHFLGHTFQSGSRLNERNADILAGRILSESGDSNSSKSIVQLLTTLPMSRFHLSPEGRGDLIEKGNRTYKIIKTTLRTLCDSIERDANNALDKKRLDYISLQYNEIRKNQDSFITQKKTFLLSVNREVENLFREISNLDTTLQLSSQWLKIDTANLNKIIKFNESLPNDSLTNLIKASITPNINAKNIYLKSYIDSLRLLSNQNLSQINNKYAGLIRDLNLNMSQFMQSDTSFLVESIYNKWYISTDQEKRRIRISCLAGLNNPLPSEKDTNNVFMYSLKGNIKIEIDFRVKKINKPVILKIGTLEYVYTLMQSTNSKFPYFFDTQEGETFYLDKNYHLWNKTIAAHSIDDKIFLQRFKKP